MIKSTLIACLLAICALSVWSAELQPLDSIDESKVQNPYASIVEYAKWPTSATIQTKTYSGSVENEKTELATNLKRFLHDAWLPSETVLSNGTVSLANMRNGNDYLLLDYSTPKGQRVRIQDGFRTGILIDNPDQRPLSEVANLVESTASTVLRTPESVAPQVFVSIMDVGKSRIGSMHFGSQTKVEEFDWWTNIRWWSDGKKVLFVITKLTNEEYRKYAHQSAAESERPRVFASRSK